MCVCVVLGLRVGLGFRVDFRCWVSGGFWGLGWVFSEIRVPLRSFTRSWGLENCI